ncbi:aminotransferase class V-fold PLP-dependent enzyme [Paenibacillus spiritus]|uniref:Aminotransferase class V-fold PLP-dependent enzyme n=1 Tax=Paenibacillus spiritus TaxID=2496557 RepID=A0A5J5GK50_9BACL|nr:aminotransferase class V-fold PLP-dependent enzyme [Paenibacillus spiritus]
MIRLGGTQVIHSAPEEEAPHADAFRKFREHTIGMSQRILTPYGSRRLLYADWTASGRLYEPIERRIQERFGPYVANPHTEASAAGALITRAYEEARRIIKRHVHAGPDDALFLAGAGMTGAVNKLQRLLGLRLPPWLAGRMDLPPGERPVVFVTHMEHHSNLLPWRESLADVVEVPPGADGNACPRKLGEALAAYPGRLKIGSFTACSNVTGLVTPYRSLAAAMHEHGGWCFVDFAASAPYVEIDMHPPDPRERLDGLFFSPHKFLGGPGAGGVLMLRSDLAASPVPDEPGGGTVAWVSPFSSHRYLQSLEAREDGGTPPFLQTIRTALCLRLKEQMGTGRIAEREQALGRALLTRLSRIPGLTLLEARHRERLPIVSFNLRGLHYNLVARMLSDRFGIQVRGGCSCAGPYGHYLLGIGEQASAAAATAAFSGDQSQRPGWVRVSLHPIMTLREVHAIADAVAAIAQHGAQWRRDYAYDVRLNRWRHRSRPEPETVPVEWFTPD